MKKVIILLADGFEEIEALAPLDILRRLNYEVDLQQIVNRKVKRRKWSVHTNKHMHACQVASVVCDSF